MRRSDGETSLQEITHQPVRFVKAGLIGHPYGAGIDRQFAKAAGEPLATHHCCNAA